MSLGFVKGGNSMGKNGFINLPVQDIKRATSFYEALGFSKNEEFFRMKHQGWNDVEWGDLGVMLSEYAFYEQF